MPRRPRSFYTPPVRPCTLVFLLIDPLLLLARPEGRPGLMWRRHGVQLGTQRTSRAHERRKCTTFLRAPFRAAHCWSTCRRVHDMPKGLRLILLSKKIFSWRQCENARLHIFILPCKKIAFILKVTHERVWGLSSDTMVTIWKWNG